MPTALRCVQAQYSGSKWRYINLDVESGVDGLFFPIPLYSVQDFTRKPGREKVKMSGPSGIALLKDLLLFGGASECVWSEGSSGSEQTARHATLGFQCASGLHDRS